MFTSFRRAILLLFIGLLLALVVWQEGRAPSSAQLHARSGPSQPFGVEAAPDRSRQPVATDLDASRASLEGLRQETARLARARAEAEEERRAAAERVRALEALARAVAAQGPAQVAPAGDLADLTEARQQLRAAEAAVTRSQEALGREQERSAILAHQLAAAQEALETARGETLASKTRGAAPLAARGDGDRVETALTGLPRFTTAPAGLGLPDPRGSLAGRTTVVRPPAVDRVRQTRARGPATARARAAVPRSPATEPKRVQRPPARPARPTPAPGVRDADDRAGARPRGLDAAALIEPYAEFLMRTHPLGDYRLAWGTARLRRDPHDRRPEGLIWEFVATP